MSAAEQDFTAAATQALNGQNDGLFLAILDRLQRTPTTIEECVIEIRKMSFDEQVIFGARDWSDDTKKFCGRCNSEHRGTSCPSSDAMARESHGL